jgi:hypothetical protein
MYMCGGSRHNRYLPKTRFSPVGAAQEFVRHKTAVASCKLDVASCHNNWTRQYYVMSSMFLRESGIK